MPLPLPTDKETQSQYVDRCIDDRAVKREYPNSAERRDACRRLWNTAKAKRHNLRVTPIREHSATAPDLDKIRAVAGNADLAADDVFDFGVFVIARSGVNRNATDITPEGQRAAVDEWIGKPIYFRDHETEAANQIGRIYDAWIEDQAGETVTMGRGYGIRTDDLRDVFARIENGIHREMSCGYEPVRSVCSACGADLDAPSFNACPKGHRVGSDGVYARDLAFVPDHISFVGRPAVEGAGIVSAADVVRIIRQYAADPTPPPELAGVLSELADARDFRDHAQAEFRRYARSNLPDLTESDLSEICERLSARNLLRLARAEKARLTADLPDGKQLTTVAPAPDPESGSSAPEYRNLKDLFSNLRGNKQWRV
ncbi:MAG: hypothetical protein KA383_12380 [Phycisphaerae bacterium]|nr:hypothetical protein [Phycisphaerae bacterium]